MILARELVLNGLLLRHGVDSVVLPLDDAHIVLRRDGRHRDLDLGGENSSDMGDQVWYGGFVGSVTQGGRGGIRAAAKKGDFCQL